MDNQNGGEAPSAMPVSHEQEPKPESTLKPAKDIFGCTLGEIVKFKKESSEMDRNLHIEEVERLSSKHTAFVGVEARIEHLGVYVGGFHPEVVQHIKSSSIVEFVIENEYVVDDNLTSQERRELLASSPARKVRTTVQSSPGDGSYVYNTLRCLYLASQL